MERNAGEVDDFIRFWSAVPGVDQVRIKEDETNLMRPDAGHAAEDWKHPCHYLWRGPMYVKQNGDVYPCCQSYMLDGAPVGNLGDEAAGGDLELATKCSACASCTQPAAAGEIDICSRCCTTIRIPAGGRQPGAARADRAPPAAPGRAADVPGEAAEAPAYAAQVWNIGSRPTSRWCTARARSAPRSRPKPLCL